MNDNKYAALNSAVWSGGSFIYVPKVLRLLNRYNPILESILIKWDNLNEPSLLLMKERMSIC